MNVPNNTFYLERFLIYVDSLFFATYNEIKKWLGEMYEKNYSTHFKFCCSVHSSRL